MYHLVSCQDAKYFYSDYTSKLEILIYCEIRSRADSYTLSVRLSLALDTIQFYRFFSEPAMCRDLCYVPALFHPAGHV